MQEDITEKKRPWPLTVPLGLFFLHSFSSPLSPLAFLSAEALRAHVPSFQTDLSISATEEVDQMAREDQNKKIFEILSNFRTGLKLEEKEQLVTFIDQESRRYGLDPELIIAVISTESSFYNWSISPKGAMGLMQIVPTTGRELAEVNNILWHGKEPLFDPFINIKLGIHYLSMLHKKFGDIQLALTAYNYGPGRVLRWIESGEAIPTQYAKKVLTYYKGLLKLRAEEEEIPQSAKELEMAYPS